MSVNVSRHINVETVKFKIKVLTPMFLGGADGHAELRAAPFRNLLRSWWRVTQGVAQNLFDEESKLFGSVHGGNASVSKVQVQVFSNNELKKMGSASIDIGTMRNPEAGTKPVSRSAYLGMGPVKFDGTLTKQPFNASSTNEFTLIIRYPHGYKEDIIRTLSLIAHFGSLGARSRRGWGSFLMTPESTNITLLSRKELFSTYGKNLQDILTQDRRYPFALGTLNDQPLIWELNQHTDWKKHLESLAEIYMNLKHGFSIADRGAQNRHMLGYPLADPTRRGHHSVHELDRMPSQIRIFSKINEKNQLTTYIMHLPHRLSAEAQFGFDRNRQQEFWPRVYAFLDNENRLKRSQL